MDIDNSGITDVVIALTEEPRRSNCHAEYALWP